MNGGGPEDCDEGAAERRVEENVEFGRYTLKQKLAAGGMGVVYVAEDRKLKRTVALKMIRGSTFADEGDVARFTLEAEAAAGLDHPNIVPIYEVGRLDGQPFFTMKLIEGRSLAERLKETGGLMAPRESAVMLGKIARAVHHAHQRGVLHRDLKPGNILLDAAGEPWLTDFGLAKLAGNDTSLTQTSDHIGTPHYMSPEVAGGKVREVSTASDVWALGVMLWELLCGMPPFHGPGPVEIMRRIVEHEPSWPQGARANGDLVTIARRCMEKNPARRPQSAGEVAAELDRWLRGEPIKARPVTGRERLVKWVRREPALAALYAVLTVGAMTGIFLWQRAEVAVISLTKSNDRLEDALCIATATKLAGDARLQVDEDSARALLLAVESVEMTEGAGVLPEAASALTAVLQKVGGLDATAGGLQPAYSDAYIATSDRDRLVSQASPDGHWLVTLDFTRHGDEGVTAAVFDLTDRENSAPLRRWRLWPKYVFGPTPDWCWLPDSRRLLTAGCDGEVRVWDAITPDLASGRLLTAPPASQSPGSLARDGMLLRRIALRRPDYGPPGAGAVYQVDAKPPEIFLGRTDLADDGSLRAGELKGLMRPWVDSGVNTGMSPCGRWLLLGRTDIQAEVIMKDLTKPDSPVLVLPGRKCMPYHMVFSRDGRRLVIRREDNSVALYDLPAPEAVTPQITVRDLYCQPGVIQNFAISPDKNWLAMTGDSGAVTLVPLEGDGKPVKLQLSSGNGRTVVFSADGHWLGAGGDRRVVNIWHLDDLQSGAPPLELRGMPVAVLNLKFSPDARSVIAAGATSVCRRWPFDNITGAAVPLHLPSGGYLAQDMAVSPDNEWIAIASAGQDHPDREEAGGFISLSQIHGRSLLQLGTHGNDATGVAFSRDGKWLASTGKDATVKVWDAAACTRAALAGERAPRPRFILPMEDTRLQFSRRVTFHPRGTLYCACGDGILFEWDLTQHDPADTREMHALHSIGYLLPDVEVSPDGRWLALCRHGWDSEPKPGSRQCGNQVLLYDVSQPGPPVPVTELRASFLGISNVVFSADSRWLAAGAAGGGPTVWDLSASNIAATRRTAPVAAQLTAGVAFSPDQKRLALGGTDGRVHLWDWQHPADLRTIHTGQDILCLAWLNDGHVAAAGSASLIKLWDTDIPRMKALARKIAGRSLTESENLRFRVRAGE